MEASGLRRRHAVRDEDDGGDENAPLLGGDHQVHARSPSPSPPSPAAAAPAPHTSQGNFCVKSKRLEPSLSLLFRVEESHRCL